MSTITQEKVIDLTKEDFKFTGLFLSEAKLFDRTSQQKPNLIFVKFVGHINHAVSPTFLYFGDKTVDQLQELRGTMVDILLDANDKGFNVKHIQKSFIQPK